MRLPCQHDLETRDATDRGLDRIVVGVDFTESSLGVAQWVGRHLAPAAELLLVHVTPVARVPNVSRVGPNRLGILDGRPRDRVRSLRGALRGLAGLIDGSRTTVEVRVGDPAAQLAAFADLVDADLVVVAGSTKYHVAPRETATIQQLLRSVSRPVLVARNVHAAPTTVLAVVAEDGDASPVLGAARSVAMTCAARVAKLHLPAEPAIGPAGRLDQRLCAADAPPAPRDTAAGDGERTRVILDAARTLRAEIVVVGTHTPAGEMMRYDGDAAAHLLVSAAHCSVLVYPGTAVVDNRCYNDYPLPT